MERILTDEGLDYRYEIVKLLIEQGKARDFEGIFRYIPKTVVANDIGLKGNAMTHAIRDPARFNCRQLFRMAELFKVSPKIFWDMVYVHWQSEAKKRRKAIYSRKDRLGGSRELRPA